MARQGEGGLRFRVLAAILAAMLTAAGGGSVDARAAGFDLKVEVSGLRNYKGGVALYLWSAMADAAVFPEQGKIQIRDESNSDAACNFSAANVCRRVVDSLQNLTVSYTFKNVPQGDYAVFVFHDENSNGVLDTGFLHRPLEARGYSQVLPEDVSPVLNKIGFDRARFSLNEPKTILIGLRYPPRL